MRMIRAYGAKPACWNQWSLLESMPNQLHSHMLGNHTDKASLAVQESATLGIQSGQADGAAAEN